MVFLSQFKSGAVSRNLSKMTFLLIFLVVIHCLSTCFSIVLLGNKGLMGGNLFKPSNILLLIINWRFILAMTLAVMARVSFMLINSTLLKVPSLAPVATTVTVFITTLSILFILVANHFILNETLSIRQGVGAVVLVTGIFIILSK
jgi:drug/metabolite transporter (DMT)-like permease